MHSALFLVSLSILRAAQAAPVPAAQMELSPEARKQLQSEAFAYAQQALSLATQISSSYLQPVSRVELLQAGVAGLYDAARQPIPSGLRADLQRLDSEEAIILFLTRQRERLGLCEPLAERRALLATCRGMLGSLDPHSGVVSESERRQQPWGDQPAGYGLELTDHQGVPAQRVLRVFPGSPAQRAGVRPGDRVTHIDGRPVREMAQGEVAGAFTRKTSLLDGVGTGLQPGDPDSMPTPPPALRLELQREGRDDWKTTIDYQEARPECVFGVQRKDNHTWEFQIDREARIAQVRIGALSRGCATELGDIVTRLEAEQTRGLILDLRWSSGGFLDEAIAIAGLFLDDGEIVCVRGRGKEEVKYHNTQPKRFRKLPLVVLVNGQTSGAAELIAAALQDHRRAAVAGQRTLGKASVQTALYVDLPNATAKLTTGEFVRPSGKNLHRNPGTGPRDNWGVRPDRDLEFVLSPLLTQRLRDDWELQTLRPGTDRVILALDDPTNDPQRERAVAWLRDRLASQK